jgi:hypothetical protein
MERSLMMPRRHSALFALIIVTFGAAGVAHAQTAVQASTGVTELSKDDMVARLLSFDRNRDGRVARAELIERMRGLVTRGDVTGDGTLDTTEINALIAPVPALTARGPQARRSGYALADLFQSSSRVHVDGAIEDLRLESPARERALAIASAYVAPIESQVRVNLDEPHRIELLERLSAILNPEELDNLRAALERRPIIATEGVIATKRVFVKTKFSDPPTPVLPPPFRQ